MDMRRPHQPPDDPRRCRLEERRTESRIAAPHEHVAKEPPRRAAIIELDRLRPGLYQLVPADRGLPWDKK